MASLTIKGKGAADQGLAGNDGGGGGDNDTGHDKPLGHDPVKGIEATADHAFCNLMVAVFCEQPGALAEVIENKAGFYKNPGDTDITAPAMPAQVAVERASAPVVQRKTAPSIQNPLGYSVSSLKA